MGSMSKLVLTLAMVAVLAVTHVAAARQGNVIRRTYSGNRECSGSPTTTTLSDPDTCMLLSMVGEGSNQTLSGQPASPTYTAAGFQCPATRGTIGKIPERFALYTTSTCGDATNVEGTVPTSGCYTGVGGTDSYRFLCGSCGLQVTDFYSQDAAPKTMKMRWFSDSDCKVKIADTDNLNVTQSTCIPDRDGVTSFTVYCPVGTTVCTMIRWADSTNCCWIPIGDNFEYGFEYTDGRCLQRGSNWVRITSGSLSAASSTANLSLLSLAVAALALFGAKQL